MLASKHIKLLHVTDYKTDVFIGTILFTTTEKKHSVYTCNNVFTYFCFTKENLHLLILSINFVHIMHKMFSCNI